MPVTITLTDEHAAMLRWHAWEKANNARHEVWRFLRNPHYGRNKEHAARWKKRAEMYESILRQIRDGGLNDPSHPSAGL